MASAWCSRPFHCRWTLGFFLGHYCELCSSELCACAPQCLCPRHCPLSPCLERTRGAMGPSAAPGDVPLLSRTVASGSTSNRGGDPHRTCKHSESPAPWAHTASCMWFHFVYMVINEVEALFMYFLVLCVSFSFCLSLSLFLVCCSNTFPFSCWVVLFLLVFRNSLYTVDS